jgi:hypothetical protein
VRAVLRVLKEALKDTDAGFAWPGTEDQSSDNLRSKTSALQIQMCEHVVKCTNLNVDVE